MIIEDVMPKVSQDYRELREHNACNRIPQHQPITDAIVQRCACCGRMFRKSEMGHVGNEVYKCMTCLMKGMNDG